MACTNGVQAKDTGNVRACAGSGGLRLRQLRLELELGAEGEFPPHVAVRLAALAGHLRQVDREGLLLVGDLELAGVGGEPHLAGLDVQAPAQPVPEVVVRMDLQHARLETDRHASSTHFKSNAFVPLDRLSKQGGVLVTEYIPKP